MLYDNVYARTSTQIVDPMLHFVDANDKGERKVELLLAFGDCYIERKTGALFAVARDIKTNLCAYISISDNLTPTSMGQRSFAILLEKLHKRCVSNDQYDRFLESGGKVQRQRMYRNPKYYDDNSYLDI